MRGLTKVLRREEGATLAIVAIALIALMGMVVLVVDVGGLVNRRREMVNANDAAALAAAKAFAAQEGGARCGLNEDPAQSVATSLAQTNVSGASLDLFTTDCNEQSVTVEYARDQDLFFAPVLGFGDSANVVATATAIWGQSMGGNPMPIELDPLLTANCVFESDGTTFKAPGPCPTGFWFNNKDLTNSSWGMMNLQTWGADPGDNCDNAGGANLLGEWITQTTPIQVHLTEIPTYVCTTDGGKAPNWFRDLESQIGKIFLFPVNDPDQMILGPPNSREKWAIIAFAPMKVEAIYHGNDEDAIGTPGTPQQTPVCTRALGLSSLGTVNLGTKATTECGISPSFDSIPFSGVSVASGNGRNRVTYVKCPPSGGSNCDYRYDETTYELTWVNSATRGVSGKEVTFTAVIDATPGTPGACGIKPSDPNAKCLVLSWAGPQLIGTDPQPGGSGFGAQSIALIK
jgi:hypothetical protein